jgi:splicing factor 3B subunit 5
MSERENLQNNFELLKNKYIGTGHSDITRREFANNMQRDMLASHMEHKSRLYYMSIAQNENMFRTRINMLNKMINPCGPLSSKKNKN